MHDRSEEDVVKEIIENRESRLDNGRDVIAFYVWFTLIEHIKSPAAYARQYSNLIDTLFQDALKIKGIYGTGFEFDDQKYQEMKLAVKLWLIDLFSNKGEFAGYLEINDITEDLKASELRAGINLVFLFVDGFYSATTANLILRNPTTKELVQAKHKTIYQM